jgi:hypothetical protein
MSVPAPPYRYSSRLTDVVLPSSPRKTISTTLPPADPFIVSAPVIYNETPPVRINVSFVVIPAAVGIPTRPDTVVVVPVLSI